MHRVGLTARCGNDIDFLEVEGGRAQSENFALYSNRSSAVFLNLCETAAR